MQFRIVPSPVRSGTLSVPGDKSISHRALMFGSIAEGRTEISGFLDGEDCLATLAAMRAMGVAIGRPDDTTVHIDGVGMRGLKAPSEALDLGNSGTAMRLMSGLLAAQDFDATLTGDASLTGRPMQRVITPLSQMGAVIESRDGKPPLVIRGGQGLSAIDYEMPMASAQVKSAVLIAGLYAAGETRVTEPAVTRDHTERMLRSMGVDVDTRDGVIALAGGQRLHGQRIDVPGDLSSATFIMLAAILSDDADILIETVGINPTRTGVIDILRGMGGRIELENERMLGEEPVADIRVRSSQLTGKRIDPDLVSLAIDEFPALFVAAAAAAGKTIFSGLEELRVKESDRIASMASGLRELGIDVDERPDGAVVSGGSFRGGTVDSHGDHRVAMALAVAGTVAELPVTILNTQPVETSFPGFAALLKGLGAEIRMRDEAAA